ncbi:hypothetical protein Enr13x_24880 [Stieleria neptunia]|uniref:Uncharacterized protein n=1 Tax=Stieleria neptunia TaxID=2527979 RepID=A0A518HP80_9BACT|nr:hypothetical protein [Stieleria neptunia]QDV42639.1 hypothetical protein Enr13x_24880 [Stieleria neptunia]
MNSDRLGSLQLLPPLSASVWATSPMHPASQTIARPDGTAVRLELPLFWYEPPWIQLPRDVAGRLAASVANLDVVVSALRRDIASDEEPSELFAEIPVDESTATDAPRPQFLPRMTPYRAERYGFTPADFDETRIIDVRLAATRGDSGRLAYSPDQMSRWEGGPEGLTIGGGGYVATGSFPTDVVSLKQARTKLDQLRLLAPSAAVFVSIDCYRLEEEIAAALVSRPDGLIVRMNQPEIEGLQLASLVTKTRRLMAEHDFADKPLWVVPGEVSARDVAKLIALGASAVAIDAWCRPLVQFLLESMPTSRYDRTAFNQIPAVTSQHLWDDIDRVIGLVSTIMPHGTTPQRLGTYHSRWAKASGAALLAP